MDDERHQAMRVEDCLRLLLPYSRREVIENVKQCVILGRRQGELSNSAWQEVRHNAATSAALSLEASNVRHRHVVRKIQMLEPVGIPIQDGRTEPARIKS